MREFSIHLNSSAIHLSFLEALAIGLIHSLVGVIVRSCRLRLLDTIEVILIAGNVALNYIQLDDKKLPRIDLASASTIDS